MQRKAPPMWTLQSADIFACLQCEEVDCEAINYPRIQAYESADEMTRLTCNDALRSTQCTVSSVKLPMRSCIICGSRHCHPWSKGCLSHGQYGTSNAS